MDYLRTSEIIIGKFFLIITIVILCACGDKDADPAPPAPEIPDTDEPLSITIDPAAVKQEMVGFGGALTWYSNMMTASPDKEEIADLIFGDLGIDIIRFKNWYYPDGYPDVTGTETMTDDNSGVLWNVTNELYGMAIERNPDIRILFSSWGPPKALKSNDKTREGTLKKNGQDFMYDEYADYWVNILDHLPFHPDYISIQNEPTYINPGWTTCQWAITESSFLPSYDIAFDKVYDKIKDREDAPVMIGPESQDVSTFAPFANVLKEKDYCGMLAWHPYNINSGTSAGNVIASLQSIGDFDARPNIMTEFSDNLDWFNTALFIQRSLVYANTSGYIYWKLIWNTPSSGTDAGIVSLNSSGKYTVTPFYYLLKHFSKHIDAGYHRVETSSESSDLLTSAFITPDNKKITLIIINNGSAPVEANVTVTGKTITAASADQSKEGSYYKPVEIGSPENPVSFPAKTITTVLLDI